MFTIAERWVVPSSCTLWARLDGRRPAGRRLGAALAGPLTTLALRPLHRSAVAPTLIDERGPRR